MRDPELDRQAGFLGDGADGDQLIVAERGVLAVDVDQVVGALGERLLEVRLADGDRRTQGDDDIAVLDLLLE